MQARPFPSFADALTADLAALSSAHLLRKLRTLDSAQGPKVSLEGDPFLNFSSNDYLGLAWHPRLVEAAVQALRRCGTGAGASRLVCGNLDIHQALDDALAAFKGTEAALGFSSGYAAALGTIPALVGPGDTVIVDKLSHACLIDAARLSRASLRVFRHNDMNSLEKVLASVARASGPAGRSPRILIVTESVFSMDGDTAPLADMVALKEKHGAWLLVDEAHATGLFGPHRRGWIDELGLGDRVEVQMGTLSKALGSSGGYIAGSRALIDFLVNHARSFIFSTAPPPAVAAAGLAAIEWLGTSEADDARARLAGHVAAFAEALPPRWKPTHRPLTPIFPILLGSAEAALEASDLLRRAGYLVPAIRYPTVPRGRARLRVTLSARHTADHVNGLLGSLLGLGAGR